MKKLQDLVNQNPKFKSDKEEYLKLAVKEGDVVRGTGPHKVKLVGCANAVNKDYRTQKEVKGVNLLFEENGESKKYFVPMLGDDGKFHYLVELFSMIDEGEELIMEYKRRVNSIKGYIDVQRISKEGEKNKEEEISVGGDDDIPIVEEIDEISEEETLTI